MKMKIHPIFRQLTFAIIPIPLRSLLVRSLLGCLVVGLYACRTPVAQLPALQFQHEEYNDNGVPLVKGELYNNGIKNGQWRTYDYQGRVVKAETYKDDVLSGIAAYFKYPEPQQQIKEEGLLINGRRFGLWVAYRHHAKKGWIRTVHYVYNQQEKIIAKTLFHDNGQVKTEVLMNELGEEIYLKEYD